MPRFKRHILELTEAGAPRLTRWPRDARIRDFNDRAMPAIPEVRTAIADYLLDGRLDDYPDYERVTAAIADYSEVPIEQVLVTNGSDQAIELTLRACASVDAQLIVPTPTFFMYPRYAKAEDMQLLRVPYAPDGQFPTDAVLDQVSERTGAIVVPNPSTSTGSVTPIAEILRLAEAATNSLVLVDECNFEFTATTVKAHLAQFDNLIITRTMSKAWGLAALRIGYILSASANIRQLAKLRGPYDVNQIAVVATLAALEQRHLMGEYASRMTTHIRPMFEAFLRGRGVPYHSSHTHYVFIMPKNAREVSARLADLGVHAPVRKDASATLGLRVGLGTIEQSRQIMALLDLALRSEDHATASPSSPP